MTTKISFILVTCIILLSSCKNQTSKETQVNPGESKQTVKPAEPNFNYTVEPPQNWTLYDTVIQGLKIRFVYPPASLSEDNPMVNIIITHMEGRNIDDFTFRNMDYLKGNLPGTVLLERGNIDTTKNAGQWFTYIKEQNGITRDMINYIIPLNGFAYMITCGTNKGTMAKYRLTFDRVAKSFKG